MYPNQSPAAAPTAGRPGTTPRRVSTEPQVIYASTDAEISKVAEVCFRAADRGEPVGLDTEFYAVDIGKQSCFARSQLHLLSVAVRRSPPTLHPRGYSVADAAVLSAACLTHPRFRAFLESDCPKAVHNLPVDAHTIQNHGVRLGGGINTLAMARWAWPGRARGAGFTLDSLGVDLAGAGKIETFSDIFTESVTEYRVTTRHETLCECGMSPCRRRSSTPGHSRIRVAVETQHPRVVQRQIPLESVGPGHPVWQRALAYSAQDAILASAVYELALLDMRRSRREIPW